jgi:hypothetical protein
VQDVLLGNEVIWYGPVPMIRSPLPGEPRPEPIFSTNFLDRIGANTSELATSGSGCFSLIVSSLAPVLTNEPTLAK